VDGFSTFPAEVVSGETARDSSGLAYEVGAGEFRYPIVEEGRYVVRVDPPEGFRFASIIPAEDLVELNDGSFVIMDASFGKDYVLNADGPLRFDIPLAVLVPHVRHCLILCRSASATCPAHRAFHKPLSMNQKSLITPPC